MSTRFRYIIVFTLISLLTLSTSVIGSERDKDTNKGREHILPTDSASEMVYLHIDRDIYIAGESILFSGYIRNSSSSDKTGSSKILYIEILNQSFSSVAQYRSGIYSGTALGSILIPDTLDTGEYLVRAYTNKIKRDLPELYFTQQITIFNPFKDNLNTPIAPADTNRIDLSVSNNSGKDESQTTGVTITGLPERIGKRKNISFDVEIDPSLINLSENSTFSISVSVSSNRARHKRITDQFANFARYEQLPKPNKAVVDKPTNEIYGIPITGTLQYRRDLMAGEGELLYMTSPGKTPGFQYSIADNNGEFTFTLPQNEENREIVIQPVNTSFEWFVKINNPFSTIMPASPLISEPWNENMYHRTNSMGVNYQISKIYDSFNPGVTDLEIDTTTQLRFYGQPDMEILLSDFISLPTLEEVFSELIPGVSLRRQRGQYSFNMSDEITGERFEKPGMVLLDGVIFDEPNLLATIDPDLIESIDIIRGEYQTGSLVFKGIISIISKKGDICGLEVPANAYRTIYPVLDRSKQPDNFTYSVNRPIESRIPDFRNTLYWNGEIHPDNSGHFNIEFYTSDYISDYNVVIEGVTDMGIPISFTKTISVINE